MSNERKQSKQGAKNSHQFLQSTIDALYSHLAILDEDGCIMIVNRPWRQFADANGLSWDDYGVGRNYLEICEFAEGDNAIEARAALKAIRGVMTNRQKEVSLEYPCHSPDERRWFLMHATSFEDNGKLRTLVNHINITDRKLAEEALQNSHDALELRVEKRTADLKIKTEQ